MNLSEFNQSDHCVHFSCPERSVSPAVDILLYVCSAAVVLLTVCGNLLVIISVFHFKQLHSPSNMLVLSLAVSDFLVGAFLMPPVFSWTIESCWIFGSLFCTIFWLIDGFLTLLSIYNIALITMDRYLALSNPFFYTNTVTTINMCIVLHSNLIVCVVYNTVFYYFNGMFKRSAICPGDCSFFLNEVLSVIDLTYFFIFPLSIIIIFYMQVFVIAKKHATAIRELNNFTRAKTLKMTSHSMKSEIKAAKVLGILVSVFLLCLLPYFIFSSLGDNIEVQTESTHQVLIILYLNSTINPVIYALFYPWFRRCFKLVLTLRILQPNSKLTNVCDYLL